MNPALGRHDDGAKVGARPLRMSDLGGSDPIMWVDVVSLCWRLGEARALDKTDLLFWWGAGVRFPGYPQGARDWWEEAAHAGHVGAMYHWAEWTTSWA